MLVLIRVGTPAHIRVKFPTTKPCPHGLVLTTDRAVAVGFEPRRLVYAGRMPRAKGPGRRPNCAMHFDRGFAMRPTPPAHRRSGRSVRPQAPAGSTIAACVQAMARLHRSYRRADAGWRYAAP